jgi:glycosyltransferase involved in cell wall biosynthesis
VVLLDRCSDGSKAVAERFTGRILEGAWPIEGTRRNAGIAACDGEWILEVDADERVGPELAAEIRGAVKADAYDYHRIPVDNYLGRRLVRYGWGAQFGRSSHVGLFRKGAKRWGDERVHPRLAFAESAREGPRLQGRLIHHIDRDISGLIRRLDRYSTARARALRESGDIGSAFHNYRRIVSRFWKCFVARKGYKEGGLGFLIALCAGLYPILSYLKARYEED